MLEEKTFTLPKKERLRRKTLIDALFAGHSLVKKCWPIKVVYHVGKRKDVQDAQVEMMVSVSKRHFKRAVKRNRVKRQLRESYRLHKLVLSETLAQAPTEKLTLAFIWMEDKIYPTPYVEEKMTELLGKVAQDVSNVLKKQEP